ncbi:MAG TPA: lytic murein transglycosylase [Pseudolabrys sp.]|nr:lytic murein transglycosylase [Pseudolabrys sp.]
MSKVNVTVAAALAAAAFTLTAAPALAAQCNHKGGFNAFIADFKKEAAGKGISKRGLAALDGVTLDQAVLAADKRQGVFKQSFEQFSGRMISKDRLVKGARHMQQNAATLKRIEQKYGVPGSVVVAIWGLETDYGVNMGKMSVVRSVATLAYDCRRTDKFQAELADALRIVDRGDMASADMKGDWAGEIGQTQFLPSSYVKYAVNLDGRGRPDLIRSSSDVLASTANYLKSHGWQRGAGWNPGEPNFEVIKEWNKADVYARTIALFAHKLDGDAKSAEETAPRKPAQKPPHNKRAQR